MGLLRFGNATSRGRRRRRALLWGTGALALVAGIAAPSGGAAASASSVQTYFVSVLAHGVYGQTPTFQQLISPALPNGATLSGNATCSEVYDSGITGPSEPIAGSSYDLDAGTYTFVSSSCSSDPTDPLAITGLPAGSYQIQLLGDVYTISPNSTKLLAASSENTSTNPPTVTLAASVIDASLDGGELSGQTVTFGFQGTTPATNGVDVLLGSVCSAVSTANGNGKAVATCTLNASQAQEFIQGTGAWTASFAGSTDYLPSTVYGELGADTSPAQATEAAQTHLQQIHVVPYAYPPNCHPSTDQTGVSLIGVSLGQLSCGQIQILQDITGATLGIALILSGGAAFGFIGDALNAAYFLAVTSTVATSSSLTALAIGAGVAGAAVGAGVAGGTVSFGEGG